MKKDADGGCVYALAEPEDGKVRYVGLSQDPWRRLRDHKRATSGKLGIWMTELRAKGREPALIILADAPLAEIADAEARFISFFSVNGDLLNKNYRGANPKNCGSGTTVTCVETGEEFRSYAEAGRVNGCSGGYISYLVRTGKAAGDDYGNFHFKDKKS